MPELPEVEVTRRRIATLLVERPIRTVRTTRQSYFFLTRPAALRRGLEGRRLEALERHGKYLVGRLDDGKRLLLHLGMTGQLFGGSATSVRLLSATARAALTPEQQPSFRPDRHTHLRLVFADGGPEVLYRDVRKFGKVKLLGPDEREPRLERLGVDALRAGGDDLYRPARRRQSPAKSLLLDQSVIAGLGNIYADECLFLAGVRPTRPAGRLSRPLCARIVAAVQQVLERAIATGGSSISDFIGPDGRDGAYQDERFVYARTGEPCRVCGTPVRRLVVAQRSSHYCPRCQT